ncbi:MAG: DUF502 domain-containing protein [Burkholderiales bacterium]|jgi:uncharacterized membrane protein|nr:DUF502 domain-containing protein [Burkholderiales bacterium]
MPPLITKSNLKRFLIAGLLVWIPLGITIWVLHLLFSTMDLIIEILPESWWPEKWIGFRVPGLGILLGVAIVISTGALTANYFGEKLLESWEHFLGRIPFVKSIYSSVKQVSETVLSDRGNAFRKALLVEFPREGSWTVAFQTGLPAEEIASYLEEPYISVYVPTTPNPTSGYFIMLPKSRVIELNMSVDEALKYVVSMGVVEPKPRLSPSREPETKSNQEKADTSNDKKQITENK